MHRPIDVRRPFFFGANRRIRLSDGSHEKIEEKKNEWAEKSQEQYEKYDEKSEKLEKENEKRKEEQRENRVDEMDEEEIEERIKRIKRGGSGTDFALGSIGFIFFGTLLSLTVIGAVVGIPMIVLGISGLIGAPLHSIVNTGEQVINGPTWAYTGLMGAENREHRKANKEFDCRCLHCNSFASLRNVEGGFFDRVITCNECGIVYGKDLDGVGALDKPRWRMIEGDSDMVGEAKTIPEWRDIRKEREIKAT